MVTIVDIPTGVNFSYDDLPPTIDGVSKALKRYSVAVSKKRGTKRDVAQAWTADKSNFVVIATEASDGR